MEAVTLIDPLVTITMKTSPMDALKPCTDSPSTCTIGVIGVFCLGFLQSNLFFLFKDREVFQELDS